MTIYNFEQNTPEWHQVRLGKLTASTAQAIATNGKGLETLCFEKVAELLTGRKKEDNFTSIDIERGHILEAQARNAYELLTGNLVKQVGFCEMTDFIGCSPDGFIGDDGLIEIKCKDDKNYAKFLYEPIVDSTYMWQVQMQMLVTGRKWCDFVVYNPNFSRDVSIIRVKRDPEKILKLMDGLEAGVKMIKDIKGKIDENN